MGMGGLIRKSEGPGDMESWGAQEKRGEVVGWEALVCVIDFQGDLVFSCGNGSI